MSRTTTKAAVATTSRPALRSRSRALPSPRLPARRPSVSGLALTGTINPVAGATKAQRTSKTTQKLVVLPTAPQTRPLPASDDDDTQRHGYETDGGVRDIKSAGERMSKEERKRAGYSRIAAYYIAEGIKMKLLASFLKREHNVQPRMYDEAMYVLYHLPLLPGYGPGSNIRSSAPPSSPMINNIPISEAEDVGYPGSLPTPVLMEGLESPVTPLPDSNPLDSERYIAPPAIRQFSAPTLPTKRNEFAEVVFFSYGVLVFFGLEEQQERALLEDIQKAGVLRRPLEDSQWEIEECHFAYDPYIAYPRVYNDFFTFKSHSSLNSLSVSHALAQSTLLARYETLTHSTLSAPATTAIPQQLASTGSLRLSRTEALKITGKLFRLRRDVNLVSNVLDVPDMFWTEGQASLRALYDAVREYMEIRVRVGVLNEKLAVAEDLLGAIHDHLNNNAMERITWIIIWLIVAACLVEVGEVVARLVFHATKTAPGVDYVHIRECLVQRSDVLVNVTREDALRTLERMMNQP